MKFRRLAGEVEIPACALGLIAEADRFMEQWGSTADMEYAQSLVQLGPKKLSSVNRETNGVVYALPPVAMVLN